MALSPYQHAAEAMGALMGGPGTQRVMPPPALPARPVRNLPGLPAVRGYANPQMGATRTMLQPPGITSGQRAPLVATVMGQPSMQIKRTSRGGVVVEVTRRSTYEPWLLPADMERLRMVARRMVADAKALSAGPYSLLQLARMGHPYGRGMRPIHTGRLKGLSMVAGSVHPGIANLGVVNQQSGALAGAWRMEVGRQPGQVTVRLGNAVSYAAYLAFGTKFMRAHGPWTSAMVTNLPALNREWLQATSRAYFRAAASRLANAGGVA